MKKVLIIGGGFAGLSALNKLSRFSKKTDIALVDKKKEFNFLPVIPDIVGRKIDPCFLTNNLEDMCRKQGCKFINEEIISLDLKNKFAYGSKQDIVYDFLLIASGSQTNFYGNDLVEKNSYKLDSVLDAYKILGTLNSKKFNTFIIAGGGYTGIEIASNLKRHINSLKIDKKVVIIEKAPSLLGPLPDWMKQYVSRNLIRLNIEFYTNIEIANIEPNKVTLSNGKIFDKSMLIWTAGVRTGEFIEKLDVEKNHQGRIKVDSYLRLSDSCFVAGDAALFSYRGKDLRMAIQFAISQGEHAAKNILNIVLNKPLREFKPLDLGYIIPMANNISCGNILGFNIRGAIPIILHYFMCIYRSFGLRNKIGILIDLIRGGKK